MTTFVIIATIYFTGFFLSTLGVEYAAKHSKIPNTFRTLYLADENYFEKFKYTVYGIFWPNALIFNICRGMAWCAMNSFVGFHKIISLTGNGVSKLISNKPKKIQSSKSSSVKKKGFEI